MHHEQYEQFIRELDDIRRRALEAIENVGKKKVRADENLKSDSNDKAHTNNAD